MNREEGIEERMNPDDRIQELYRRGKVRKYFLGPGNFLSGEGFGFLLGGGLCLLLGGWLFPKVLGDTSSGGHERYIFLAMALIGIPMLIKGIFQIRIDIKKVRKPTSDLEFDGIFARDVEIMRKAAEDKLNSTFGPFDGKELTSLYGPSYYSANVNLPLLWHRGEDRFLRYSNISFIAYMVKEEQVYIYTCIYNVRNGVLKFEHTYKYNKEQILDISIADTTLEGVSMKRNKAVDKRVSMMAVKIFGRTEEVNELSIVLKDYQEMEARKGLMDDGDARAAVERLRKLIFPDALGALEDLDARDAPGTLEGLDALDAPDAKKI